MKKLSLPYLLGCLAICSGPIRVSAAPTWNQFRGPNGQGVAEDARPPTQFGPAKNVVWKTPLGPGHSSPVLWDDRIFLTTFRDKELETVCFDTKTGKELWRRAVTADKPQKIHVTSNPATSTPAVDAERVYSYFGLYGVLCHDHAGKELWRRDLPVAKTQYGAATSPILHGSHLILVLDANDGSSRLLALNQKTGETAWETPRPTFKSSWTTPILWANGDATHIVTSGGGQLTAYDPASGKKSWFVSGVPGSVSMPVIGDGLLFASGAGEGGLSEPKYDVDRSWQAIKEFDQNGNGKIERAEMTKGFGIPQRMDLPRDHPGYAFTNLGSDGLLQRLDGDGDKAISEQEWKGPLADFLNMPPALVAVRAGATGDARETHVAWERRRGIPEIPSPLYYRQRLHLVRDGGLFTCLEAKTGKELFSERLQAPGQYAASPIAADGRIYLASVNGMVTVVAAEDKLRILGRNNLGEQIFATPALADRHLYVRTASHLYAFGDSGNRQPFLSLQRKGFL